MKKYRIYLAIFMLFLLSFGCASAPYPKKPNSGERYTEMEAELLFDESKMSFQNRQYEVAIKGFRRLVENYPESHKTSESMYFLAESYYHMQNYDATTSIGNQLIEKYPRSAFIDDTYFLLGKAYQKKFEYYKAAKAYINAVDYTDDRNIREESEKSFRNVIARNLSNEKILGLTQIYSKSELIPIAYTVLAQKYLEQELEEQAKTFLEFTITTHPLNPYTKEAENLYDEHWGEVPKESDLPSDLEDKEFETPDQKYFGEDVIKIGLLCPLSGKYASYGISVKRAVEMALEEYKNANPPLKVALITVDSKGEPVEAVKGVRKLIDEEEVLTVIGPIMSGPTISAASFADIRETPLITPTATENAISSIGEYIFQLNTSSSSSLYQAEVMAEYAYERLGHRTFGLLYPSERHSMNLAETFSKRIIELGGVILAREEYLPGNTDFKVQMKALKEAQPEAIYIPVSSDDVLLITPQIKYYNISTQILGADGWNSQKVARQGDYYVEGAIFTALFYDATYMSDIDNFYYRYKYKYGIEPNITTNLGYDTAKIIFNGILKGATTRDGLRTQIANTRTFEGTSGKITFLPEGNVERKIYILTISSGKIIEISD